MPLLFIGSLLLVLFSFSITKAQSNQTVPNGQPTTAVTFPGTTCIYTWSNSNPAIGLPGTGTGNINSFTAINTGNLPITGTITATPLSGGYAYIANLGGNSVSVINTSNNQVVATVIVGTAPEGVSVTPDGSKVYVGNSASNTVSVINTSTNTVMATITVGIAPQGIVVSPDGKRVYVVNSGFSENSVSVINTATNAVIKTIGVGQNPRGIAISPDGTRVYATNNTSSDVSVINTSNNTVIATIPVGVNPAGVTVSPDNKFAYTVNQSSNDVSVIDASTNHVINTISVGSDPFSIIESQDGKFIYTANLNSDNVSVINTTNNSVTNIQVDTGPLGTSFSADGKLLYIPCGLGGLLDIIDVSTGKIISKLTLQQIPNSFGNFIRAGDNCGNTPIVFTITVKPDPYATTPTLTAGNVSGTITACQGSPSASPNIQQFTVSGSSLTADVTAAAPAGFEISMSPATGYSKNITIKQVSGPVNNVIIYVRSSASAAPGNLSGNVVLTTQGLASENIAVAGIVNALPTVNKVADQSYTNGQVTQAINFTGSANAYTWTNDKPGIGLGTAGTGNIASFTAINNSTAPVTANITVTPVFAGYAYIAGANSNAISVINTATNVIDATIPVGQYPYYECLSPDASRLYVSEKSQNAITTINTATKAVIGSISFGSFPTGIAVSPDGSRVYAASSGTGSLYVINAASNSIINTIAIGSAPEGVIISPDGSSVYVANNGSNMVAIVNTANNTAAYTPLIPSAFNLAISPDGGTLYVTSSSATSKNVYIVNTATKTITGTITVGAGPQGIAINGDGSRLYVSDFYDNTVSVVNIATKSTIAVIPVHQGPSGISISPDGSKVYVTSLFSNDVTAINTSTNSVITSIPVGYSPYSFGKFISSGSGCSGVPVTFTITVNPTSPSITAGTATGSISACAGTPSVNPDIQQFVISGVNLTSDVTAIAPANFEISLTSNGGYGSSITIPQTGGALNNVVIYVRSSALASAGNISGNVVLKSSGAPTQNIAVKGVVNALPIVNAVANQIVANGANTKAINFTGTGDTFTWTNDKPVIGLPANGTGSIASFAAVNNSNSTVVATIVVTPSKSGVNCPGVTTAFTISVTPTPIVLSPAITASAATGTIAACAGSASISPNIQQFTVSGNNLTGDIVATAPVNFELSLAAGSGYNNSITIPQTAGIVGNSIIYIRSTANAPTGNISGNVILTSPGVTNQNIAVAGVINALPTINSVANQTVVNGAITTAVNFTGTAATFTWTNSTPGIGLPSSGTGNIASFRAVNNGNATIIATITVTPLTTGNTCNGTPISFTITVNPTLVSVISATGSLSPLVTTYGTPSSAESFAVSGSNLASGILVTPPAGFEVSADNSSFNNTVVTGAAGNINATNVYIRLAATTPVGSNYSGNIVLSATGATASNIAMPAGKVIPALLTVTPNDKSKAYGDVNPVLTATYTGFVNDETVAQLTLLPTIETPATRQSPVGIYPITASGAMAYNYTFLYNTGILTIIGKPLIPNVFTPNNDGHNDTWNIQYLDAYPNCLVNVYDRYGQNVHTSHGYSIPWNGTRGNTELPNGTYYYVINLNNGQSALSGYVVIMR